MEWIKNYDTKKKIFPMYNKWGEKKNKKQKKTLVYKKGAVKEFIPLDQWESHFAHLSKTYYIST